MKQDSWNLYLAIGLSILVIIGWNFFYNAPQQEKARQAQLQSHMAQKAELNQALPGSPNLGAGGAVAPSQGGLPEVPETRAEALAAGPRIKLDTPSLFGSINLHGARIDDVSLKAYRETTDANSPNITLLSPSGSPAPYYAEAGFVAQPGSNIKLPTADTLWTADRDTLTPATPVTLSYDNDQGLIFHRKIAVDDRYMFTVTDAVENKDGRPLLNLPNLDRQSSKGT